MNKKKLIPKGEEGWLSRITRYLTDSGNALKQAAATHVAGTLKALNAAGDAWHNFWNLQLNAPMISGNLYSPVYTGTTDKKPMTYTTTPKLEAGLAMAMAAAPALAVSAGTVGLPVTVGTVVGGTAASKVGEWLGEKTADILGLNENAKGMFGTVGEFAGITPGAKVGGIAGDFGDLAFKVGRNLYKNPYVRKAAHDSLFDYDIPTLFKAANYARTTPELRTTITNPENYTLLEPILNSTYSLYGPSARHDIRHIIPRIITDVGQKNGWRASNFKFLGDTRFYSDTNVSNVLDSRINGNYPLTFAERKKWISDFKNDIQKGIRFTRDEALNNSNLTGTTPEKATRFAELRAKPIDKMTEAELDEMNELWDLLESTWKLTNLSEAEQTAKFGTRKAINTYSSDKNMYPSDNHYQAFAHSGNTYYPFRTHKNTLHTHKWMTTPEERTLVGAHEYEHTVQGMYDTPLVVYHPKVEGEYGRYTNEDLPSSLSYAVKDVIDSAGSSGKWEGSLAEMDSELKGWRALYNYPKYTKMTPLQKLHIIDLANDRFGIKSDFSTATAKTATSLKPYSLNQYIEFTLPNLKFHKVFTELESAGYKQGGKLISKNK